MNIKWICQNNLGSTEDIERIKEACDKYGYLFEGVKVIPFSDNVYPESKNQNDFYIFYGAVRWVDGLYRSNKYNFKFFLNNNFDYRIWGEKYKGHVFNEDYRVTTLEELSKESNDEYYFIRPTADDKAFSGTVLNASEINLWVEKLIHRDFDIRNIPIIASKPKIASKEWRLFIIDGKVCSGSSYRTYSILNTKLEVPKEVIKFAEDRVAEWAPSKIFVIDIAIEDGTNDYKVMEIGCACSAGFYNSNIEKIVYEISEFCKT